MRLSCLFWLSSLVLAKLQGSEFFSIPGFPKSKLFVLLTEQRSGSSWLTAMLDSHPEVSASSEILLDLTGHQVNVAQRLGLSCAFCLTGLQYPHEGHEAADVVRMFLNATASSKGFHRIKAAGFKLLNGQAGLDLSGGMFGGADGFRKGNRGLTEAFLSFLERERAKIILLERQGIAKEVSFQLHAARVSRGISGPNGSAWCADAACVARFAGTERVKIDASSLLSRLDYDVEYWSSILNAVRKRFYARMLYVSYDDLAQYPAPQMQRILRFLGANETLSFNSGATLKMSSEKVSDQIENLDEVAAALRGTRWEVSAGWWRARRRARRARRI